MRRIRLPIGCLLLAAPGLGLATNASATIYTDALGDNYGGPEVDIAASSSPTMPATSNFKSI